MAVIYPQPSGVMDRFWITLMLALSVANGWGGERLPEILPQTAEALRKLKLPGITLNLSERAVDVNATVCLREGLLELVACTQGSKEHESIVSIAGRPIHIHTALLLFGARPGTPALRMAPETREVRWIPVKPAGDAIQVSLVFPDTEGNPQEHPIHRFIAFAQPKKIEGLLQPKIQPKPFPDSFLFAGSHLVNDGANPKKYLCEQSGNIISISTFGDELLCLAEQHGHENDGLVWEVNSKGLPAVGTAVILRLRPKPRASKKTP